MSRITGVVVALATTVAVLSTASSGAAPPAPVDGPVQAAVEAAAELPREITGGVELTMADGDRLRLWATERHRAVVSRRWDAATGTWGPRRDVVRNDRVRCGAVDARTADGAVAAIALCDEGGYYEDTAPVASRALWSPDGVTWSSHRLDGEAYEEPGISPDGQNAVWPQHQRFTTRTSAGWSEQAVRARGQEYTVTATITDAAQVSFLYGGQVDRRCPLTALTVTGDAAPVRQEVALGDACSSEADLVNVDADTALFGYLADPGQVTVLSRSDTTSPWAVTRIAPLTAPGLQQVDGRLHPRFVTAPGLPLLALGSVDGRAVLAQAYDPVAQRWHPPSTVFTSPRRCRWADDSTADPLGVVTAGLVCGRRNEVVLTTQDGTTWQSVRGRWSARGLSPDGASVAIASRTRTAVISRDRGVVTLAGGAPGRCDVVVPDGPDGAVLLTAAGRNRDWPTVLQHSDAGGWTRLGRTSLPTPPVRCRSARASTWEAPARFDIYGGGRGYTVRVVERDGTWTVRRSRS